MSRFDLLHSRRARLATGAGALSIAGAAAVTVRHIRALAADEELGRLRSPLRGHALEVPSADGTVLHAEVFGPDSGPTVVLVPGWTEQLSFFDPMTRRLVDRGFRVIAYDLRGQGQSAAATDDSYDIERYGEDLEAVLATGAPGRSDVIVAGHSLGAMSIASWAAEHAVAARARAVVLMNTGVDSLVTGNRLIPAVLPATIYSRLATSLFLANPLPMPGVSTPLAHEVIRYVAFGPDATRAQVAFYERMLTECQPRVRAAAGLMMSTMDLLHALPNIDVPALVIAGDCDRLTPDTHAERIAEALPALERLLILRDCGHMGPLERPDEIVSAIAGLAEALKATGPAGDELAA